MDFRSEELYQEMQDHLESLDDEQGPLMLSTLRYLFTVGGVTVSGGAIPIHHRSIRDAHRLAYFLLWPDVQAMSYPARITSVVIKFQRTI
jgi:hypothetical protein